MSSRRSLLHYANFRRGVVIGVVGLLVMIPFVSMAFISMGNSDGVALTPSVQSINLSSVIPNGQYMVYDQENNLAWVSELGNSIASINLTKVMTSGTAAVHSYSGIFPAQSSAVGTLRGGASGITLLNGLVYTDANYSGGVALASVNASSGAVNLYYSSLSNIAAAMASKGSQIFISGGTGLLIFNTLTHTFSSVATYPASINYLVVFGDTIYFVYTNQTSGQGGIGRVNTDGSGLKTYGAGEPAKMIAFDSSGNIWFTGTDDLVEWNGASFVHYTFVGNQVADGPEGLVVTPSGIWVLGNSYHKIRFFQFSLSAFNPSSNITTTLRPWMGILDSSGNVWGFALDGFTLMEIPNTFVSTVTSTVTTGPTTTITQTTTMTSSVTTTRTVTTTVTSATATVTTTVTASHTCDRAHGDSNGDAHGHGDQNGRGNGDDCKD
ncbi:MAG: hypothetical protein JRN52_15390 [Nitrososphaerota archaeon]|nr:hypothetical protein [Nitrososphaerota archaeon]